MANPVPTRAQALAEAYRRGLMPPQQAMAYEEAAKRGIANDPYAAGRAQEKGDWLSGASLTLQKAWPGFPEVGAGMGAATQSIGNMLQGKPANFGANWNAMRAGQAGIQDQYEADHPGMAGALKGLGYGAQVAGALASGGASEAPAVANAFRASAMPLLKRTATRLVGNAVPGAGIAAVNAASQPGTLQQRAQAAIQAAPGGALIGAVAPEVISGAGNAMRAGQSLMTGAPASAVAPEVAQLARIAMDKHGIPLRTGQIQAAGAAGDRAAAIRDSNLIATDPRFQASQLAQRQAFTTAVANTFGANGPLTTDAMAAARARLSAGFEQHAMSTGMAYDDLLKQRLAEIGQQAKELGLSDNEQGAINGQIDKINEVGAAAPGGVIPGPTYQSLTQGGSTLSKIINAPHGSYGNLGSDIRTALQDAAARAGGPDAAQHLADLRSQWANMKTVEPLAEKAGPEGLISPSLLQGRVNATFDNAAYGSGADLKELGDIGQTFLKEPGNSQTTPRLLDALSRQKGALLVGGAGADLINAFHDPVGAAGIAGTAALGYAANKGINAMRAFSADNPAATATLLQSASPSAQDLIPQATNALVGRPPLSITSLTHAASAQYGNDQASQ